MPKPQPASYVYADFEGGIENPFTTYPTYSGTTDGVLRTSTAEATDTAGYSGQWSQKLTLYDDTAISGGWRVRHLSGLGSYSQNTLRSSTGWIGFFAKTASSGIQAAIAADEGTSITELSDFVPLIADGQWHLYEWNLEDSSQWNYWVGGNGIIDTENFTLDSIQFTGPDSDAIIYIDRVMHNSEQSLTNSFQCAGYRGSDCSPASGYAEFE